MRRLNAPNSCDEALATKVLRLEILFDMRADQISNYGLNPLFGGFHSPTILTTQVKDQFCFQKFSQKIEKKS